MTPASDETPHPSFREGNGDSKQGERNEWWERSMVLLIFAKSPNVRYLFIQPTHYISRIKIQRVSPLFSLMDLSAIQNTSPILKTVPADFKSSTRSLEPSTMPTMTSEDLLNEAT